MQRLCTLSAWLVCAFGSMLWMHRAEAQAPLQIVPSKIDLHGFQLEHLLSVREGIDRGGQSKPLGAEDGLTLSIQDPQVAELLEQSDGMWLVKGKQTGTTRLIASRKTPQGVEVQSQAILEVRLPEGPIDWEFANHIEPILARNGCNMGACHGALAGKGGFRLSLRGYDPPSDHFNLVRQQTRSCFALVPNPCFILLAQPEASLVLLKASGVVSHKGGVRLPIDSVDYRIMLDWIGSGARGIGQGDSRLESVEVLPQAVTLRTADRDQLTVVAKYSDGRSEDVTRWAKFTSSDESIALVDPQGRVQVLGPGEGTIVAWFSSRIASSRIRVPFELDTNRVPTLASIQE